MLSLFFTLLSSDHVYGGDLLMNAGLQVENLWGDAQSKLYHLIAE